MNETLALMQYVGRTGKIVISERSEDPCYVSVEVVNAKKSWNQVRLQCKPLVGAGMIWKSLENVYLDDIAATKQETSQWEVTTV